MKVGANKRKLLDLIALPSPCRFKFLRLSSIEYTYENSRLGVSEKGHDSRPAAPRIAPEDLAEQQPFEPANREGLGEPWEISASSFRGLQIWKSSIEPANLTTMMQPWQSSMATHRARVLAYCARLIRATSGPSRQRSVTNCANRNNRKMGEPIPCLHVLAYGISLSETGRFIIKLSAITSPLFSRTGSCFPLISYRSCVIKDSE